MKYFIGSAKIILRGSSRATRAKTRSLSDGMRRCARYTAATGYMCLLRLNKSPSRRLSRPSNIKTPTAAPSSPTTPHNRKLSVHGHGEVEEGFVAGVFYEHSFARAVGVQAHRVA